MSDISLPFGCVLRQATQKDIWSIRILVLGAKLDPTQIKWQQFWLIEYQGKIIACGQLRNFLDTQELGSLVVKKAWQNQGIGTYLVRHLVQQANKPLYLECLGQKLERFYSQRGFVKVQYENLPSSMQGKFKLSQLGKQMIGIPVTFMQYP
ncbi:MAG: GNAT family N-acetyltransferase [Cyanobacteria bacterium P01_A01_bin.84]